MRNQNVTYRFDSHVLLATQATTHYQAHMSKELIKLIHQNPDLFDEYRVLVIARVLEQQEREKAAR
jgi:hypothetical protein